MNVVGYVRVAADCSIGDVIGRRAQLDAIGAWSREHRHNLIRTYSDGGDTASSDLETRLGLGDALQAIRDNRAEGIVVARLDRLALSVILQEELLSEIECRGAVLFSAWPGEECETTGDARDPTRLFAREVIREVPAFRAAMRDLWVRQRLRHSPLPEERAETVRVLTRAEELIARGVEGGHVAGILASEGFRGVRVRPLEAIRGFFGREPRG